jgi:prephenate dehydrogenase
MLLLNLLGGRLPFGYRMVGDNPKRCAEMCMSKLDRVLRRIRRVAEQLEMAYSEG